MKIKVFLFILFCSLFHVGILHPVVAAQIKQQEHNKIIAVVGDKALTTHDLEQAFRFLVMMHSIDIQDANVVVQIKQRALQMLIDMILIEQEARRARLEVQDEAVNNAFVKLAGQQKLTSQQFEHFIINHGLTLDTFKRHIKKDLIFIELIKHYVRPDVALSQRELDDNSFLKNAIDIAQSDDIGGDIKKHLTPSTKVKLAQIILPLKLGKAKLEDIMAKIAQGIVAGVDFRQLAAQYSHDNIAAQNGGVMGWIAVSEMSPQYLNAILKLQPNHLSQPFQSNNNLVILKVLEFKNISQVSGEDSTKTKVTSESKKLEQLRTILVNIKFELKIKQYIERIRQAHFIKLL